MLDDLLSARPGSGSAAKPATPRKPSTATATEEAVDTGTKTDSSDRGINFTMFLTMMSERLFEFDPEAELREAFECFDESDSGFVSVDDLRKWMGDVGERMDPAQVCHPFGFSCTMLAMSVPAATSLALVCLSTYSTR